MTGSESRISEEQARRLWERAAELQAEADREREEEGTGEPGGGASPEVERGREEDAATGYSLTHVRQAALEVGIRPDVLGLALGEEAILELEGGAEGKRLDRVGTHFLSDDRDAVEVRRSFAFPARRVWLELERQLLEEPHCLEILDSKGGRPEEGEVVLLESPPSHQDTASVRYWATFADIKRFLLQILPDEGGGCSVLIRAPLRRSRRVNGAVGVTLSAGGSLVSGLVGMGVAVGLAGTAALSAGALVLVFAGLMGGGAAGGGMLTRKGYRALYRYGLKNLLRTWERILSRVERDLERKAEGGLPPPP